MNSEERAVLFSDDHRRELRLFAGECACIEEFVREVPDFIDDIIDEDDDERERYDLPEWDEMCHVGELFDAMNLAEEYMNGAPYEEYLPKSMDRVMTFTLGGGRFDVYAKDLALPEGVAAEAVVFHEGRLLNDVPEELFWPGAKSADEVLSDAVALCCDRDRTLRALWICEGLGSLREEMSKGGPVVRNAKGTFIEVPVKRLWRKDSRLRVFELSYLSEKKPGDALAVYSDPETGAMLMTDPVKNEVLSDSAPIATDRAVRSILDGDHEAWLDHAFGRRIEGLLGKAETDDEKSQAAKFKEGLVSVQEPAPMM